MENGARKKKRSSKRSSILKIGRSPPRGALCDLDPNAPLEDDTKKLRLSRRVSFAETCQVKEFLKDSCFNSGQQLPPGVGNENAQPQRSASENAIIDPSSNAAQTISGLDNLLTGQIKSTDSVGNQILGLNIADPECQDDDVFLPDHTVIFQDGAELEITKCSAQQTIENSKNNMTMLSQSSMDLTYVNNGPCSSVSSVGNFTVLSSSDMDITACVTPNMLNPVPGIMITRPSSGDETNVPENDFAVNAVVELETKFNTAAFLQKISSSNGNSSSFDEITASSQIVAEETQPKIDVLQFLAKMTGSATTTTQEINNPVIYVPNRPLSTDNGMTAIPRDPYTLSNETDFDTMINTSVNKYTGLSHVTSAATNVNSNVATTHNSATDSQRVMYSQLGPEDMQMQMPMDHPPVTDESVYKNWSTETTRVFGAGNTSRMEMTLVSGNETIYNANEQPPLEFASQLQSALQTASQTDGQTRIFAGDEDTADMEFTACLTTNLGQVKSEESKSAASPSPFEASPGDVTKCVYTDMEFTLCNITVKSQVTASNDDPAAVKVDSQAFLKKLTGTNASTSINAENACIQSAVKTHDDATHSSKIDSQAFLSKLTGSAPNSQSVDVPSRERTTTEGSEDMEFTACINQVASDASRITEAALDSGDITTIFGNQENMEFTACITQALKDINEAKHPEMRTSPMADTTKIFSASEENMEFTTCITQAMTHMHAVSENKEHSLPVAEKTKIFSASEENMELTTCITQSMQGVQLTKHITEGSAKVADKTKIFEEDNMEFTTCLSHKMTNCQDTGGATDNTLDHNQAPGKDIDTDDSEIVFQKKTVDDEVNLNIPQTEECVNGSESHVKSRKRSHPPLAPEMDAECGQGNSAVKQDSTKPHVALESSRITQEISQEDDMISNETEPKFVDSPIKDQEVTTGLRGLMSKVKKARKSIGTGETTSLFNADMTLGQMELTTCAGGIDSQESTAVIFPQEKQNKQHDITRHFQNDDLTSVMELTKCVTSTLPSLRDRLNEMTRSNNLGEEVVVAMELNKSNLEAATVPTRDTLLDSHRSVSEAAPASPLSKSESRSSSSSTENIDIMNEMPPSLIEISINTDSPPEQKIASQSVEADIVPSLAKVEAGNYVSDATINISVEDVRNESKAELSITNMEFTEIHEMDETKSEKSRLFSTESEHTATTKTNDHFKSIEEASKESLLLSVATMNKSLGLLPANLSCLEPKVTKGLSSISFVERDQLSLCDDPPKSIDDFLGLLGFHSYNERLCRRSTLAPYSMKAPETFGEHLELVTVIEPKVQVYDWACDQMETMAKKIQTSNDDVGTGLLTNLPQPFIDVANPQISSKIKQTYKPVVRNCKLKAEQTMKEWRSKMVKSEMDTLQQEMQLMEKGVKQLKDAITSVDKLLENINSEKSQIIASLDEIEREEPASDEQVQQFGDYEEQIVIVTADLEEREANMESLQSKLQGVRKENEELTKQTEELRSKINNCESPQASATSVDDLCDQMDNIHSCTEWELKSVSENLIIISWLFNSLNMEIELAPSASNKTPQSRYLTNIKFVSQLSESAAPWAFLAQRMVTKAVSTRALDEKYPTTKFLGQMLEELSPVVWHARALGDEMSDTCLFHDTVIDGCMVAVKFVSLAAFCRFTVTFKLQPGKYPNESVEWALDCDVGDLRKEDLDPVISACKPGQFYMHRLVKSIQYSLEKRAHDLKVQF